MEEISKLNVDGIIIATSLYNGTIDLKELIEIYEKGMTGNEKELFDPVSVTDRK